ncbi:hypothetical protein [Aeromonas phage ZPAH34]|uniref:hypothetical protein n=1 Tax=Aeromonas phage ZPAH34 TaxID=2924888 RepID=UPI0023293DBD|nr:hypothetical protein PQD16_gp026 [Aeromonas phage ZPAH34]UOX39657.1 hypothetical protein [Aeromonas phage ZPAH34]
MLTPILGHKEIITFHLGFPGIPIENGISAVGALIQTYGITHAFPVSIESDAILTTGDPLIDTPVLAKFLELKNLCHHINETFTACTCKGQIYDNVIFLTFECSQ